MQTEELAIADAYVCTPRQFADARGTFLEWFRGDELAQLTGRPAPIVQANHSLSRRGTVRGVHYADVPPGQAKWVYCPKGAVLDIVVDIRVGSPTYGEHVAVQLDDVDRRAVYLSEGLGHAFVALSEWADVCYLVSTPYNPSAEHGVHPLDPALALPWPDGIDPVLSDKDAAAPMLADAAAAGALPSYDDCRAFYAGTR